MPESILPSSEMLRSLRQFGTEVSGLLMGPTFFRNVGVELFYAA